VKAAVAKAGRDRRADASRRLIAEDDCRQYVLAAGAAALGHGKRGRDERRAGMDDVAQIAVVGGRGVAHRGIDPRGVGHRQFGPGVEPQRGLGGAAALAGEGAQDRRGFDPRSQRRAGQGAGDQHRGMIDGLRGQIGRFGAGQELGQFTGDGHPSPPFLRGIGRASIPLVNPFVSRRGRSRNDRLDESRLVWA
jgi:hypothetical protein